MALLHEEYIMLVEQGQSSEKVKAFCSRGTYESLEQLFEFSENVFGKKPEFILTSEFLDIINQQKILELDCVLGVVKVLSRSSCLGGGFLKQDMINAVSNAGSDGFNLDDEQEPEEDYLDSSQNSDTSEEDLNKEMSDRLEMYQ